MREVDAITRRTRPYHHQNASSGHKFTPIGESFLDVNGLKMKFHIVNKGHPILGQQACTQLILIACIDQIDDNTGNKTNNSGPLSTRADQWVSKYADISPGLGLIKTNAKRHVALTSHPLLIHQDESPMPFRVIAKQHQPTSWVNSITIVCKPNKLRVSWPDKTK